MGYLEWLEMENFKSYMGLLKLGPFSKFSAVIGPNGSGKSNIMDAVSFVLGEKTGSLRVKKLDELVHGANVGNPISNMARVSAIYCETSAEGELVRRRVFTRIIRGSTSEYKIDDKKVTVMDYQRALESIDIFIKHKNFLVFQGAVEQYALKNPMELSELFEQISGSGEFKAQYQKALQEKRRADEQTAVECNKKKGIAGERKEALLRVEETQKYQRIKDDYKAQVLQQMLLKLFINEKKISHAESAHKEIQHENDRLQQDSSEKSEQMKLKKQQLGKASREIQTTEKKIMKESGALGATRPKYIKAKESTKHKQTKQTNNENTLEKHKAELLREQGAVEELQVQQKKVEKTKEKYIRQWEDKQKKKKQSDDKVLTDEDKAELAQLKYQVGKESGEIQGDINAAKRAISKYNDLVKSKQRQLVNIKSDIERRQKEFENSSDNLDVTKAHIEKTRQDISKKIGERDNLAQQLEQSKGRSVELQRELNEIGKKQGDARVEQHEVRRRRRKAETVNQLKGLYDGVFGRLIDLINPVDRKYNIALTKIIGGHMDAIVVDCAQTAQQCIRYLKEQRLDVETFLPCEGLKTRPLDESVREKIRRCGGTDGKARLFFDVIKYEPSCIRNVVLFAVGNSLVAENDDSAENWSYGKAGHRGSGGGKKMDAVSLTGTHFTKSGMISSGLHDLKQKAKRWDERELQTLQSKRDTLEEELREVLRDCRGDSKVGQLDSHIRGLQNRLRYSEQEYEDQIKRQDRTAFDMEMANKEAKRQSVEGELEHLNGELSEKEGDIVALTGRMNQVEDTVCAEFCQRIGIKNIREVEKPGKDREREKREAKVLEFDTQIEKLINSIAYKESEVKRAEKAEKKWTEIVKKTEDEIDECEKVEKEIYQSLKDLEEKVKKLQKEKSEQQAELKKKQAVVDELRKEVAGINKEIMDVQRRLSQKENEIEREKTDRFNLLRNCRLDNISIPLLSGSLKGLIDDVDDSITSAPTANMDDTMASEATSAVSSAVASTAISRDQQRRIDIIKIDFKKLPREVRSSGSLDRPRSALNDVTKKVNELRNTIDRIVAPSMNAERELDEVSGRYHKSKDAVDRVVRTAQNSQREFQKIKKKRYDKYMECFNFISETIDEIYKHLTRNAGAQAVLVPENSEEPYLEGVQYNCIAPGKRFRPMESLSGGEKTVAALALIFAIHKYRPSPFFILDEVDAALDNTNIGKVASFIRQDTNDFQTIVISLKNEFFKWADMLIGVFPEAVDEDHGMHSGVLTLDLTKYSPDAEQQVAAQQLATGAY